MPRRALALVAVSLLAVGLVVASLRGEGEAPVPASAAAPPRPPKPLVMPSGAVAIDAPRAADGGLAVLALPAVAAMAASVDAGVRPVPFDTTTGKPLEPSRIVEGTAAGKSIPVPRRVVDRGVITN